MDPNETTDLAAQQPKRDVTNRLDLPAELIAEMYRLRWTIEMFFRTFKHPLGCQHLISRNSNGVEIQA